MNIDVIELVNNYSNASFYLCLWWHQWLCSGSV